MNGVYLYFIYITSSSVFAVTLFVLLNGEKAWCLQEDVQSALGSFWIKKGYLWLYIFQPEDHATVVFWWEIEGHTFSNIGPESYLAHIVTQPVLSLESWKI